MVYKNIPRSTDYIRQQPFASFRRFCSDLDTLPTKLYIKIYDIVNGAAHYDDLFSYFMKHAKAIYPHRNRMTDLKKIIDLTNPANWYPDARQLVEKSNSKQVNLNRITEFHKNVNT